MGDLSMILILLGVEGGQSFVLAIICSLALAVGVGKSLPGGGSRSRVPWEPTFTLAAIGMHICKSSDANKHHQCINWV